MTSEHYHDIMKRYMFHPDGGEWPEPMEEDMKRNFDLLYKEIVLHWVDNEFKQAVLDDTQVMGAVSVVPVSLERGDSQLHSIRALIGSFTLELTKPHRQDVVDAYFEEVKSTLEGGQSEQ